MMKQIFFGSDPEYIFKTREKRHWIPPYGPHMEKFPNWHGDGANWELVTPAFDSVKGLVTFIQDEIEYVEHQMNARVSPLPVNELSEEIFKYDECKVFGCNPDINTIGLPDTYIPEDLALTVTRRPAGGHFHISSQHLFTPNDEDWLEFIHLFKDYQSRTVNDQTVKSHNVWNVYSHLATCLEAVVLSYTHDASIQYARYNEIPNMSSLDSERRRLYGRQGNSRPKVYMMNDGSVLQGIEIRSPSPIWTLVSPGCSTIPALEVVLHKALNFDPYEVRGCQIYLKNFPRCHCPSWHSMEFSRNILKGVPIRNERPKNRLPIVTSRYVRGTPEDISVYVGTYSTLVTRLKNRSLNNVHSVQKIQESSDSTAPSPA